MKYKTLDLFAGIGGIRRGFELTGRFENVLSAEIDQYACQTYEHLYSENPKNDVTSAEFKEKVEKLTYDVLLGGFPCQAFSTAGKKEGFRDKTRGTLFFDVADIIERTRPKAFLLENVEGLIRHKKGETFKTILETLVIELDYKVIGVEKGENGELIYDPRSFLLNSRNFGVPQNRPRIYMVGFNQRLYRDKIESMPLFTLPKSRSRKKIYDSVKDVLEDNVGEKYYLSEGYLETLKKHKEAQGKKGNGFGYSIVNLPEIENPVSNALLATGGSGKERNLIYDYKPDIVGKLVKSKKSPLNSEGVRIMTPNEWGKLQGFVGYAFKSASGEDTFSFPEKMSDAQRYKQFGNSVTIPVIEEIAYKIVEALDSLERS
ncbi:DNA cytosine methyltransferase [Bacillus wiedmannii]|uniref:DNA cytosine methyltransferase n=1 Tax=Bacillus wiedmannii TaxID=1890302 RepID=UPI00065B57A4|nr:DNA cytosine methyltransferase [Bacillus wiedmannii]KMP92803.1 restriction endonuclease HpaII [Bacillus wiedmannii]PEP20137.1 DNA (cytosine-5-)-methyltransferase [Bacillus wiedmannii]PHB34608.1 DNA (cytosine-5-)-methyltransferase [Bacillus wiedmannii]PHC15525.1 DNA (cytosine-5-)-methyltransferase [Bacillus wiedmannii]SCN05465.1 Cytosine-specific methyltransferase [Bacillus wiedmannii]